MSLEAIKQRTRERVAAGVAMGMKGNTPRKPLPVLRRDCIHLGQIVEYCTKCRADIKHVHDCSHPDNPTERCTIGQVGTAHWNCQTCPNYQGSQ